VRKAGWAGTRQGRFLAHLLVCVDPANRYYESTSLCLYVAML